MPCNLRIVGEYLDIDNLLKEISLAPTSITRKGEIGVNKKVNKTSRVVFETSAGDFDNVKQQITETTLFLEKMKENLVWIKQFEGVDSMTLDFGINSRIRKEDVSIQYDFFPPELVKLAGELGMGIELSQY